jgi:hypothetical protein
MTSELLAVNSPHKKIITHETSKLRDTYFHFLYVDVKEAQMC